MKIVKKRTIIEMEGGASVDQTAWQPVANELVRCEFRAEYPSHTRGLTRATGGMGIFLGSRVERIRFSLRPRDISQPGAPAYDRIDINFLEFSGSFLGSDLPLAFTDNFAMKPKFDGTAGWAFEFVGGTSRFAGGHLPHKFDTQATAEIIVANCICTESFEVSMGSSNPGTITEIFARVTLGDTEGLRQAITDIAGETYLNKLLRMHGYKIDRAGPTQ